MRARAAACCALLALAACGSPPTVRAQRMASVEESPPELAILPVEDRTGAGAAVDRLREELAAAAVEAGFTPLARPFVDAAGVDPDVPALEDAGVLRVRLLDWRVAPGPPLRLDAQVHASLYQHGLRLVDWRAQLPLEPGPADPGGTAEAKLARLRARLAAAVIAALPPPPAPGFGGADGP